MKGKQKSQPPARGKSEDQKKKDAKKAAHKVGESSKYTAAAAESANDKDKYGVQQMNQSRDKPIVVTERTPSGAEEKNDNCNDRIVVVFPFNNQRTNAELELFFFEHYSGKFYVLLLPF